LERHYGESSEKQKMHENPGAKRRKNIVTGGKLGPGWEKVGGHIKERNILTGDEGEKGRGVVSKDNKKDTRGGINSRRYGKLWVWGLPPEAQYPAKSS